MKHFFLRIVLAAGRRALKLKAFLLMSVLGALGLCVSGCPCPQPVYGVIVLYGPPYAMKADMPNGAATKADAIVAAVKPAAESEARLADEE